jgi:hypothetical protein
LDTITRTDKILVKIFIITNTIKINSACVVNFVVTLQFNVSRCCYIKFPLVQSDSTINKASLVSVTNVSDPAVNSVTSELGEE